MNIGIVIFSTARPNGEPVNNGPEAFDLSENLIEVLAVCEGAFAAGATRVEFLDNDAETVLSAPDMASVERWLSAL